VTDPVIVNGSARLVATGRVSADAAVTGTATAYDATIRTDEETPSTTGSRVSHSVELRFHEVENAPGRRFYVEVHRGGEMIACGYGDDEADAILELIGVLVPPTHRDYEQLTEQPDDLL
jgi:hypothetical protein